MRIPSKLYSFEESTLHLFMSILQVLAVSPQPVRDLFSKLYSYNTNDVIEALAALYTLGTIRLDKVREVISLAD